MAKKLSFVFSDKLPETTIQYFRGVPILTLEPSFLMTEKLLTFIDRQAGRDIFDAWFIIDQGYPLKDSLIKRTFDGYEDFYQAMVGIVEKTDAKKLLQDTGKLLGEDYRKWIKPPFCPIFPGFYEIGYIL